jgi:transposase
MEGLQAIIGTDKKNPVFTVCRREDPDTGKKEVYVYYGHLLLEVIEDRPDNPELKLMLARLYNARVKAKSLIEHFGYSYPTLKRWSEALKSGDAERLVDALSGQGAPKKVTVEIESFVSHSFDSIYRDNKYSYSAEMRKEIKEVFGVGISAETLRPLLKELKEDYLQGRENRYQKKSRERRQRPGL